MMSSLQTRLINFLQSELGISAEAIELAQRYNQPTSSLLPIVLWQYGLISIEQLDQIFAWLETANQTSNLSSFS